MVLYNHLLETFNSIGPVGIHLTKTMTGIFNGLRRIARITAVGKDFIHVVFPFKQGHADNLCFQKIAQVPGDSHQFNHHFRMYCTDDVNEEVQGFMRLAFDGEVL